MADVQPLQGILYNSEVLENLAQVIPMTLFQRKLKQNIMLATLTTLFVSNWGWTNQMIHP